MVTGGECEDHPQAQAGGPRCERRPEALEQRGERGGVVTVGPPRRIPECSGIQHSCSERDQASPQRSGEEEAEEGTTTTVEGTGREAVKALGSGPQLWTPATSFYEPSVRSTDEADENEVGGGGEEVGLSASSFPLSASVHLVGLAVQRAAEQGLSYRQFLEALVAMRPMVDASDHEALDEAMGMLASSDGDQWWLQLLQCPEFGGREGP